MKEQKIGENSLIRKYIVRIGMKEQKNRTKKFLRKYIVRIRMMLELECKRTRHGENNVRSGLRKYKCPSICMANKKFKNTGEWFAQLNT